MNTTVETETRREQITSVYLPQRGLLVDLPPSCSVFIDSNTNEIIFGSQDKTRVAGIMYDTSLKRRYPTPQDGEEYMDRISPEWRDKLLAKAQIMTEGLIEISRRLGHNRFAVVLFGSIARKLVKHPHDPDRSNIDLAVIGDFSSQDRETVLNEARPLRQRLNAQIKFEEESCVCKDTRCACVAPDFQPKQLKGSVSHGDITIDRVGIIVQSVESVTKDDYSGARNYMGASGRALYDPSGLWMAIEQETLPFLEFYSRPPAERAFMRRYGIPDEPKNSLMLDALIYNPQFRAAFRPRVIRSS